MSIQRQRLHEIIDQIADEKLPKIVDLINFIYEEEQEELSLNELAEIDHAKQRIANGDYATFDEVFGDLS